MKFIVSKQFWKASAALALAVGGFSQSASAQRVAISTDVVEWATQTANIAVDARLGDRVTLGIGVCGNPFKSYFGDNSLRTANFRVQPRVRYWFNRAMARNFIGFSLTGGTYDLIYRDHHYNGDIVAASVHYGYALVLSKHWNVEFSGGLGVGYTKGYSWPSGTMAPENSNVKHAFFMPDLSVSFTYVFK